MDYPLEKLFGRNVLTLMRHLHEGAHQKVKMKSMKIKSNQDIK